MKQTKTFKSSNKEANTRIKIKEVSDRIENQRIERLIKKPLSIEERIIGGHLEKK